MTLGELETKLVQAYVTPPAAKMIATMALDPGIERHERSWAIPASLVIVPNSIRPDRHSQQRHEALQGIMGAVIKEQKGAISRQFMIVTDLAMARGNAYLSYSFSPEFIQWAELAQRVPSKLH